MGDFGNSTQIHDFEPGIEPSGLFWTTPVSPSTMSVDPDEGRARLRVRNMAVPDFHDFLNAVSPDPTSVRSHVSFDVRWRPTEPATTIRDETFGFVGTYVPGSATIDFAVRNDRSDVVYRSEPHGQNTLSGGVGRERNGVFFR